MRDTYLIYPKKGILSNTIENNLSFMCFSVICLYKTFASSQFGDKERHTNNNDDNDVIETIFDTNNNDNIDNHHNKLETSDVSDAKLRIKELEYKILQLETRIPRRFPDVTFLNYKNRKRILVKVEKHITHLNPNLLMIFFKFLGNWWCRFCWFTFS